MNWLELIRLLADCTHATAASRKAVTTALFRKLVLVTDLLAEPHVDEAAATNLLEKEIDQACDNSRNCARFDQGRY